MAINTDQLAADKLTKEQTAERAGVDVSRVSGEPGNFVITPESLKPVAPLPVPPASPVPNYNYIIASTIPETPITNESTGLLTKIKDMLGQTEGKSAYTQEQLNTYGVPDIEKRQREIASQLTALNNETQAGKLRIEGEAGMKGITRDIVSMQQSGLDRVNAIKALSLSSEYAMNAGNLETAKEKAQLAVDLKYKDTEDAIDRNTKLLQLYAPFMSQEQKDKADAIQAQNETKKTELADKKKAQTDLLNFAQTNGDVATAAAVLRLDPNSSTFNDDLAKLQEKANPTKDILADVNFANDYTNFVSTLTPGQDKVFKQIPESDRSTVIQLINGDALIADVVKSRGAQGTNAIKNLINYATAIDPNFSVNQNKIRYEYKKNWDMDNVKGSIGNRTAINTALGHLAELDELSKKLPQGTIGKMNSVQNVLKKDFGDPSVTNFRIALEALGSELARVYKGGVPDAGEITRWQENLAESFSKKQFNGAFDTASKLLSSKITSLRYNYKTTMGKEWNQSLIDPDKKQALIDAGISPDSIAKENIPLTSDPLQLNSKFNLNGLSEDPLNLFDLKSNSTTSSAVSAEKIAEAIKSVESNGNYNAKGGSGEFGAYQFMPSTWSSWAGTYLGNPNAPMTPLNQDRVAHAKINDLLNQGYDPQQIALIWNGGTPTVKRGINKHGIQYDSGAYAQKVLNALS